MRCFVIKKLVIAGIIAGTAHFAMAQTNVLRDAAQLEEAGRFKQAAALLDTAIHAPNHSPAELKELEFELDRLERIRQDYTLTRAGLYEALRKSVKGLTIAEFDGWVKDGWFDAREIDGTLFFFDSSVSNLYFRHPELNARRIAPKDERERERRRMELITAIKQAARAQGTPYVLPKTFRVDMSVTADANAAPGGETIRAWIPIPRRYPFQSDFKLLSSSQTPTSIGDEASPIRSIYFEQVARNDQATKFDINYEFTARGVHFELQPDRIQPFDPNDDAVRRFTGESPHVVFTPEIKALSAKIVDDEKNPMLKAKKIYDWLAGHLLYSYATEYSTIRNISDYCRAKGYGDCGQQALLFITLCRLNGVPARWQSGWDLFPNYTSNHDWTEIYLAPYGWIPVDPYVGNYAMRYTVTLTPEQKTELRDFYFGGLDQYRMAANSDHDQPLEPPKKSFRSDDVDFQRGELEHNGTNIYFNQFSYHLKYQEMPPSKRPE